MSTFKDLLSKNEINQLKHTAKTDPQTSSPNKATDPPSSTQLSNQNEDDLLLFKQAMVGVSPLKNNNTAKNINNPKNKKDPNTAFKRAAATGTQTNNNTALSDMQALLNPVATEAFLSYKNSTLPIRVFEQLKQGKLRWFEAVDLHGATIDEARSAITELIAIATDNNQTVVKIVHGKGADALLKTCVNGWLRQIDQVLAFVSAPAKDGGTGAVLVLLKRPKQPQTEC